MYTATEKAPVADNTPPRTRKFQHGAGFSGFLARRCLQNMHQNIPILVTSYFDIKGLGSRCINNKDWPGVVCSPRAMVPQRGHDQKAPYSLGQKKVRRQQRDKTAATKSALRGRLLRKCQNLSATPAHATPQVDHQGRAGVNTPHQPHQAFENRQVRQAGRQAGRQGRVYLYSGMLSPPPLFSPRHR